MIEALVAMTITATAGAALLTSIGSAMGTSRNVIHRSIARGLAEQLMDEMAAVRFPTPDSDHGGVWVARGAFDDLDDYDGWCDQPPTDRWGEVVGTEGLQWSPFGLSRLPAMRCNVALLQRFRREVTVEPVTRAADGSWVDGATSSRFRRVTVRVFYLDDRGPRQTVCILSRIFAYVPFAP